MVRRDAIATVARRRVYLATIYTWLPSVDVVYGSTAGGGRWLALASLEPNSW